MTERIDAQIAKLNQRLKAAKLQVSVERRNNWLWVRGTFPPKPHLKTHQEPYRQRFSLDLPANQIGLQQAERKAKGCVARILIEQKKSLGKKQLTKQLRRIGG